MYSDAHTHLTSSPLKDPLQPQDVREVLRQARAAGVAYLVASGHDFMRSKTTIEIAAEEDIVYASIGLHPWIATPIDDETYRGLLDLAKKPKVVAVGEIGMDENRSRASKEVQIQAFTRQLELAQETDLPVYVHQRGYRKEVLEIVSRKKPPRAVIHGFVGDTDELRDWLDLGFHVTIGRVVTGEDGEKLRPMVEQIPEEKLLLETDGVNKAEDDTVGGQARIVEVARVVGKWRGKTPEEMGEVTTKNLRGLLRI